MRKMDACSGSPVSSPPSYASYVRRALARPNGPAIVAVTGITASTVALSLLSNLSRQDDVSRSTAETMLYAAAALLAVASATVINALNALASLETEGATADLTNASIDKGAALGAHRSSGQLGRAVGPLIARRLRFLLLGIGSGMSEVPISMPMSCVLSHILPLALSELYY